MRPDSVLVYYADDTMKTVRIVSRNGKRTAEVQRRSSGSAEVAIMAFYNSVRKLAMPFHRGPLRCTTGCPHGLQNEVECGATTLTATIPDDLYG